MWTVNFLMFQLALEKTEEPEIKLPASVGSIGEGNGNLVQYPCLENPRDGGAWWAAVYGVVQSWTWLKWLSSSSSWIIEKAREFQKTIYFWFSDYTKAFVCVDHNKLWKILKDSLPISWETGMWVKKQQLKLDMEQLTGSELAKEYIKTVYCHPGYLTSL